MTIGAEHGEPAPDRELIADYVNGSPEAYRTIASWIRAELEHRFPVLAHETDDIVQAVHQKLLGILRAGRFESRSTLRTFVSRVTRYTAVDLLRRRHRDRAYLAAEAGTGIGMGRGPYLSLLRLESTQLLRQILLLAPAACRELWRMAFVEQLSYTEIGRRLDIPGGTVKSRMWYCRRKALSLLAGMGGQAPPGSEPAR